MKRLFVHLCLLATFSALVACEDEGKTENPSISVPTVVVDSIGGIIDKTAILYGKISSSGRLSVSARGVIFSETNPNPTMRSNDGVRPAGGGGGSFSATASALKNRTTYYLRLYAVNLLDTVYSDPITHFSAPRAPRLNRTDTLVVDRDSLLVRSRLTDNGLEAIFDRGFILGTRPSPNLTTGTRIFVDSDSTRNDFSFVIRNLAPNTQYYVRSYARNRGGVGFGSTVAVKTKP